METNCLTAMGALYSIIRSEIILPSDFSTQNPLGSAWTLCNKRIPLSTTKSTIVTTSKHKICCWKNTNKIIINDPLAKNYMNYHHSIITYENGNYQIKDMERGKSTFINGKELGSNTHNLVDGDIISLGCSQNDPIFKQLDHPKLLFYFKGPNSDHLNNHVTITEEIVPEPKKCLEFCQSVLRNPLLLSEILSSLPPTDLKNVRLVNKTWNRESSSWFYAKTVKKLPYCCNKNAEYLHLDPGFPTNCKNATVKIEENLYSTASFVEKYGRAIRVLDIDLDVLDFELLLRILPHLVNLFELKLTLTGRKVTSLPTEFPETGFPFVKSLAFKDCSDKPSDWSLSENFFVSLVRMFPSLEQLAVTDDLDGKIQNDILSTIKKNPSVLNGIKRFAARFEQTYEEYFRMYQGLLDLPFQHSLTHLEFSLIPFAPENHRKNTGAVTQLLNKFASTLESLSMTVGNLHDYSPGKETLTYVIPPLPELKTLKLKSWENTDYYGKSSSKNKPWLYFEDYSRVFGHTKDVDYQRMFPKLKTLIFEDNDEMNDYPEQLYLFEDRLTTPFIQEEGDEKCLTVTRLGLPKTFLRADNPHYQKWLERITEIFPNVHSPSFRAVRDGHFHLLEDDSDFYATKSEHVEKHDTEGVLRAYMALAYPKIN